MEDVNSEVISEILSSAIIDLESDTPHRNEIKKEFSLSAPCSYGEFVENAVVKHEDTKIQSLAVKIEAEVPVMKSGVISGNDDIHIKFESLVHEELHIKNEIGDSPMDIPAKPFQCNICDYRCQWKSHLQRHIRTHTGEKPLKCAVCGYSCIEKGKLNQHMKTHTGEKPLQCTVCGYRCIRKSDLQRHNKTHTGEKPFKCNVCGYRCIQKSRLQQHMKTHNEEKLFQCDICDYKCIWKCNLRRHLKNHIRE